MIDEVAFLKVESDLSRLRSDNIELKNRINMLADMVVSSRQYVPPPRRKVPVLDLTGGAPGEALEPDDVSIELTPSQGGGDDGQLRVKGFGGSGKINPTNLILPSTAGTNPEYTGDEFLVRDSTGAMAYRKLCAPGSGGGGVDDNAFPFKLARSQSVASTLIVYLPENVLLVNNVYISPIRAMTVDHGSWYCFRYSTSEAVDVWLRVSENSSHEYVYSFDTSSSPTASWSIFVGHIGAWNEASDATWNCVRSALVLDYGRGGGTPAPITTETVDVVTNVAYSESTHACTQTKKTLTVLGTADPQTPTSNVFQATDHQNEH